MKKIWVNGTFDVLHVGHIRLLNYAAGLGVLKVGLDSDQRVKKLKGMNRPINCLANRMEMIESLKSVSHVCSFNSDSELENLIKEWKPDYMIIGNDYLNKNVIGRQFTKELIFFEKIPNQSTTIILKKLDND